MAEELATTTYSVSEPFEQALRSLRKVLAEGNLRLAGELDISSRIRQRLLISTPPCVVLLVMATPAVFEELGADPCVAALTPLHIVVSARGSQTEIHLMRAVPAHTDPLDRPTIAAFRQLQARITGAVERIGMRTTLGA
jgi:uncharacterized protein (DUF302 family)